MGRMGVYVSAKHVNLAEDTCEKKRGVEMEKENVGELAEITDKGNLAILCFRTQDGEVKVSLFKDGIAPELEKDATYRFRTTQYNGYTNLAPVWTGKTKTGYKIEKIAPRVPPREVSRAPVASSVKVTSTELRISRLSLTSSSCIVCAALINEGKVASAKEAEEFVLAFAKKLEQYAVSAEAV